MHSNHILNGNSRSYVEAHARTTLTLFIEMSKWYHLGTILGGENWNRE